MTQQEFMKKYGSTKVVFERYYKYSFTYKGDFPDGSTIVVSCGGSADDIYKHEVVADQPECIAAIDPTSGTVYGSMGETLEEFIEQF